MIKLSLLNTLYQLSKFEAHRRVVRLTTGRFAQIIESSQQTASRHLSELEKMGFIMKEVSHKGIDVKMTDKGVEELRSLYLGLKKIIDGLPNKILLEGTVFTGFKEGNYYVSQKGYKLQFKRKLGFDPYPGTLNLRLHSSEIRKKKELMSYPSITIEGFELGRSFGEVRCYHATINDEVEGAVVIIKRTHYDDSVLEVIAPVYLRKQFNLEDGSTVKVEVHIKNN